MSHHCLSRMAANIQRLPMIALILPLCLLLTGCATRTSYMGIAFAQSRLETQVQSLARRAQSGNKQAQLALGIRFEAGIGVPFDIKRARKLYRLAATTTGGTSFIYVPPVTRGGKGSVVPVNTGARREGLSEARERLQALDALTPETALRRRLDYMIRCLRTEYRCDSAAAIGQFRSALPSVSDVEARERLTGMITDRRQQLTIVSLIRRSDNRFDAVVIYTERRRGACDPTFGEPLRNRFCRRDPGANPGHQTWRITVRSDDRLDIAIDAAEQLAMTAVIHRPIPPAAAG